MASNEREIVNFCLSNGISAALYPMTYVKVLMQIGYEPCPPQPGKSFFGKPILVLPGIIGYSSHIYQRAGLGALYQGVVPHLIHKNISQQVNNGMSRYLKDSDREEEEPILDIKDFLIATAKDTASKCTAVVIAHPFHVIFVRSAAQFVGRECTYSYLYNSITHIFKTEGIPGFFSGLIPSLLYEALTLWITNVLIYTFNTVYADKGDEFAQWPPFIFNMVAQSLLYPFVVTSNCMAVTDSGLVAGQPDYMPRFKNWIQCWRWLSSRNELKRGGSIFLARRYLGPQVVVNGCAVPISCSSASS